MNARSKKARAGMAMAGLVVGLAAAEVAFRVRDHGAFPHLNVYARDEKLGVRLRPLATEKVAFNGNPVTSVRIGAEGFRGGGLPDVTPDEIIVVGDSQVFGLGVEENETFSAALANALPGRNVLNAGVPTYGPGEYLAVAKALLEKRHPDAPAGGKPSGLTVVYVVNLANDLFEASRPNTTRHTVWDGWAVRKETAPASVTEFPGRALLFRDSHAFFALRGAFVTQTGERGFQSEGSWKDLAVVARDVAAKEGDPAASFAEEKKKREDAVSEAQRDVEKAIATKHPELFADPLGKDYAKTHGSPEDIVVTEQYETQGEASRPYTVTVTSLVAGAKVRHDIEARILAQVRKDADRTVAAPYEERVERERKLDALLAEPLAQARASSPMAAPLLDMKAIADAHGARLVVVALPLDVQVSAEEWAKYGVTTPPIDVGSTRVLADDIVELARSRGVSALDPREALAAAEPGAFLRGDLHMTPKGHRALADALAVTIKEAPPSDETPLPLPKGRTRAPSEAEWKTALHMGFDQAGPFGGNSDVPPLDCEMRTLREWVRLRCKAQPNTWDPNTLIRGPKPVALSTLRASRDTMTMVTPDFIATTTPVTMGADTVFHLEWEGGGGKVSFHREGDLVTPRLRLDFQPYTGDDPGPKKPVARAVPTPGAAETCACHAAESSSAACDSFPGAPDADCARTFATDCAKRLRCESGDPFAAPRCLPGYRRAGALEHCAKLCSDDDPCKAGSCTPYMGISICM